MKIFILILILTYSVSLKSQINGIEELCDKTNHISYYHLNIEIDPENKYISGEIMMNYKVNNFLDTLELEINSNFAVLKILNNNKSISYCRKNNDLLIFPNQLPEKSPIQTITIFYEGIPKVSEKPPWDAGFIWSKDSLGNPYIGVVCELEGAGIWWPALKDISIKPDSLLFSITIPSGLYAVSNGILRSVDTINNKVCYNWFNQYPIINYNLTLYIGKYHYFTKPLISDNSYCPISYYSLNNDQLHADMYLNQIDTLLNIFAHYFGRYPFSEIGYKLVDAPYAGMEHQTAIAIGKSGISLFNLLGYNTNIGYILVHETAHEWWGNSISIKSMSDLWINESFASYSESLFLEYLYNKEKAVSYINQDIDYLIKNEIPICDTTQNINYSHDIYFKGSAVWNTFRHLQNDDSLWFDFLHAINRDYRFKSISTPELINYINKYFNINYSYFFNQYIYSSKIPLLEIKIDSNNSNNVLVRWNDCNTDFRMPLLFNYESDKIFIDPSTDWKSYIITKTLIENIKLLQNNYLIRIKVRYEADL